MGVSGDGGEIASFMNLHIWIPFQVSSKIKQQNYVFLYRFTNQLLYWNKCWSHQHSFLSVIIVHWKKTVFMWFQIFKEWFGKYKAAFKCSPAFKSARQLISRSPPSKWNVRNVSYPNVQTVPLWLIHIKWTPILFHYWIPHRYEPFYIISEKWSGLMYYVISNIIHLGGSNISGVIYNVTRETE
jgi:hypothetical protein